MSDSHPETRPVSHQYELAVLGEECGEVIQIVGKTLRFGYESCHPDDHTQTNLDHLHNELGDVLAAIDFATERGLLDREKLLTRQFYKRKKLLKVAPPQVPVEPQTLPVAAPQVMSQPVTPVTEAAAIEEKRAAAIIFIAITVILLIGVYLGTQFNHLTSRQTPAETPHHVTRASIPSQGADDILAGSPPPRHGADDVLAGSPRPR